MLVKESLRIEKMDDDYYDQLTNIIEYLACLGGYVACGRGLPSATQVYNLTKLDNS